MPWRPTATREALAARAALLARIRAYFSSAGVLEVETPLLGLAGASDPALASFAVATPGGPRYLQTSPEYAMKRLLAAGVGDVYQICKAFRDEQPGQRHRSEFTVLEWYRTGFDYHALMDEVAHVFHLAQPERKVDRLPLATLAARLRTPDPHTAATSALAGFARAQGLVLNESDATDRTLLLDWLLEHLVRFGVPAGSAAFVHDFPVEHAAYAQVRDGTPPVAERFELVVDGLELANGWTELRTREGQAARLAEEAALRAARGLPAPALDPKFLGAMDAGLPPCAGVALGLDRLLMVALGRQDIAEVLALGNDEA